MTYVFRNNTIERFLCGEYQYSGYNDFSSIPEAEAYLWWYQVPLRHAIQSVAEEVMLYADKLSIVVQHIGDKPLQVITLDAIFSTQVNMNDESLYRAITHFNHTAYTLAEKHLNIKVIDFSDFTKHYAVTELIDWKFYYLYQMPINPRLANDFHIWWAKQQDCISLKRKKCIVLDLDNTLWAGIIGEDGVEGISFDGDYPGKAFAIWHEGLKQLKESGIILAICSKNNEEDVMQVWKQYPNMILTNDDFAAKRINWNDKATNIQSIAEELNIGLDSMVFIDDNPSERELIRQVLPMVEVPEWSSQPYDLAQLYNTVVEKYFKVYAITEEDKVKTLQYHQNALRSEMQSRCATLEDFIKSLNIELTIRPINEISLQRVAQMTQKTNQFNLTTKRYTEQDIQQIIHNNGKIYTLSVKDRFGDSGITGCMMLIPTAEGWEIDTLLLSCRILGKGIEYAFVKHVLSQIEDINIIAHYYPTEKNRQVSDFYEKIGFTLLHEEIDKKDYVANTAALDLHIEHYYTIK